MRLHLKDKLSKGKRIGLRHRGWDALKACSEIMGKTIIRGLRVRVSTRALGPAEVFCMIVVLCGARKYQYFREADRASVVCLAPLFPVRRFAYASFLQVPCL